MAIDRCLVCGVTQVDRAHIKSKGSGGSNEEDNLLLLCRQHHIESHRLGWNLFCKRYPVVRVMLNEKGWEIIEELGVPKLRKMLLS
jgi:hypothetical protein